MPPLSNCTYTSVATSTTSPPLSNCTPTPISMVDTNITPVAIRLPLSLTIEEVGAELRRLQSGRASGPDGVCPRLLRDCAEQLAVPLQRVPVLLKVSCLILVPKLGQPVELNDYRLVALTSHIMKTLERLLVHRMRFGGCWGS